MLIFVCIGIVTLCFKMTTSYSEDIALNAVPAKILSAAVHQWN